MLTTITAERPDTPDALLLIDELQTHLESVQNAWPRRIPARLRTQVWLERGVRFALPPDETRSSWTGVRR